MNFRAVRDRVIKWFRSLTAAEWLTIFIVLVVIAVVLLATVFAPEPDPALSSDLDPIRNRGVLRVGLRTDLLKFSVYYEEDDAYAGMEYELAAAIAGRIFGSSELEITPVNFNTGPAKLRKETLDCALGIFQKDMNTSLLYSNAYYTDAVAVMVMTESGYASLSSLAGRTVGCINRDGSNNRYTARNLIKAWAGKQQPAATVVEFASSSDMLEALADGKIDALCAEYALLDAWHIPERHTILPDALGTMEYAVAFPAGSETLCSLVNNILREMEEDGSLAALWNKWGLTDYRSIQ